MTEKALRPSSDLVPLRDHHGFEVDRLRGWVVISMQPIHRSGTRLGKMSMLLITLRYPHTNGEYIQVDVSIDTKERLYDLLPFLEASRDLPEGIRLEIARSKPAPWNPKR